MPKDLLLDCIDKNNADIGNLALKTKNILESLISENFDFNYCQKYKISIKNRSRENKRIERSVRFLL